MAGCSRSDPTGLAQMWLTLALSILQVIPTHLDKAEAQTPDIVHNELMQLMEEVALKNEFASQGFHIETENDHLGIPTQVRISPLKPWQGELNFDPPLLDFGEVAIGMPQIATVRVFNPQQQSSLRMVSISGTTPHFHCSFFQEKVIPAGGNTTFEIVFLPRLPGNVENTIFIHSNKGSAPYQVFGIGVPNPYRLRPILGARVPLNTSFSPLINMHNPYSSVLMVTEMYSSGGDLHLELPTGSQEAPQNLWEIPPYQTRSVMRASFTGRVESNHTAFIRIKTNHSSAQGFEGGEFLMLPVEVEVSSAPGLYSSLELIDFGTLRSLDEPRTIQLYLLNTSPKVVQITSVSLVRTNQAISIDFKPLELSSTQKHKNVANITFHPLKANYSRFWAGKIIVKTKDKNIKLQIPYQAHVLPGTLSVVRNSTFFHLLDPPQRQPEERKLHLTNYFNFSIVIHQANLVNNAQGTFEIKNFSSPIVIPPHETDSSLSLSFTPSDSLSSLSTMLRLGTNASLFTIPVHAYTGKLKFFMYGKEIEDKINLGTAGLSHRRVIMMTAVNDNPVEVPITFLKCTLPRCEVVIVEVKEGNKTYLGEEFDARDYPPIRHSRITVPAHHYALLLLRLTTPETEGLYSGIVQMETKYHAAQYETILKAVEGYVTVKPEKVEFPLAYPGLLPTQSITLQNSFSHKMTLESLKPQPPDEQFYFRPLKKLTSIEIEASKKQKVGKIVFDARKRCHPDCYVGLPTNTPDGQMWLSSLKLDDPQDVDRLFYNFRRNKWLKVQEAGLNRVNATMKLATSLVRDVEIAVTAELRWPKLTSKDIVKFPMTLVDSGAKSTVTIINPTESTILLQVVPITAYKDPSAILDLFSDRFNSEAINIKDPNPFSVRDIGKKDCRGNCVKTHLSAIEDTYGVKPDPSMCAMALKSKQNATVHLSFRPYDNKERLSLFVIRNNLTVVDGFLVQGMGAKAELKLSNKLPGPNSNIVFDMKAHHLNDCDRASPKARTPPHFTVKRTLTLKNTGQIALHIHSWYINGQPCEGYGFRVLQCEPIFVQPNSTARLDITFCPDFSLARVVRTLQIQLANKELLEYKLIASLPSYLLSTCAAAVPRPTWEYAMYSICVGLMSFFFVVIFTVAYLEAVRFMEPIPAKTLTESPKSDGHAWKKLDFRPISGMKIDETGKDKNSMAGSGDGGGGGSVNSKNHKNSVLGNLSSKFSLRQRSSSLNNNKQMDPRHTESKISLSRDKMKINDLQNSTSNNRSTNMSRKEKPPPSTSELSSNQELRQTNRIKKKQAEVLESPDLKDSSNQEDQSAMNEPSQLDEKVSPDRAQEPKSRVKRKGKLHNQGKQQSWKELKNSLTTAQNEDTKETIDSDDISSTTTEESTADSEHAERGKRQSMNQLDDFAVPSKDKHTNRGDALQGEEEGEDFEDVKSRGRRKYLQKTGDLNKSGSLELPYTTQLEAGRKRYHPASLHASSKEPTSPHSLAAKAAAKATRSIKLNKAKPAESDTTSTTSTASSERDKDSPPPLWELPKPVPSQYQHPVAYPQKATAVLTAAGNPFAGGSSGRNNSSLAAGAAGIQKSPKTASKDKPNSYSSVVSGKSSDIKKPKLSKITSAPSEKVSAFTSVQSGGSKHNNRDKKSAPWTMPRDVDSASDTSSGPSGSPPNSGVFHTPKAHPDQGPAKLRGPSELPPYGYGNDDLGIGVWNQAAEEGHTKKASTLPFASQHHASRFAPSTSGAGSRGNPGGGALSSGGDDWTHYGVSKAPGTSSLWKSPPGFPPNPNHSSSSQWPSAPGPAVPSSQSSFFSQPPTSIWDHGSGMNQNMTSSMGSLAPQIPMPPASSSSSNSGTAGWNTSTSELFPNSIWSSPGSSGSSLLDGSGGLGLSNQETTDPPSSFSLFSNSIWSTPSSGEGWNLWSSPNKSNKDF